MDIAFDMLDHGGNWDNKPGLITVHSMAEFIDDGKEVRSARDFLDHYKLSAHVLCNPDGSFTRCRADEQVAWHARGHNTGSLGIEILLQGVHDYSSFLKGIKKNAWASEKQMEQSAEFVSDWMRIHSIPIKKVVRHSTLSPDRKVDPGSGFNWVSFQKTILRNL